MSQPFTPPTPSSAKMFGWISIIVGVIGFVIWCFVIGLSAIMAMISNRQKWLSSTPPLLAF